jgi:hypothetical protein
MKNLLLPLAVSLIALSSQLEADISPPTCAANTLAFYDTEGFSCILGGGILGEGSGGVLEFSGFSFSATGTGSPTLLTASQIEVTPDPVGQGGGFTFTATGGPGFTVGGGQTATYDIDYEFTFVVDPVVSGANIGMDPPFGTASISEEICHDDEDVCQSLSVDDTNPPTSWNSSITLDPPITNFASIDNTITLDGSACGDTPNVPCSGFGALNDTYAVAPEPATFVLLLGELVAIGLVRRYRSIR